MSLETELTGEFDARKWAEAFVATVREHPEIPTDEGTMTGWFANAIMAGYDHAGRQTDDAADAQDFGPPRSIWGYIPFHDEHVPVRYRLTGEAFCRLDGEGWPCAIARGVRS